MNSSTSKKLQEAARLINEVLAELGTEVPTLAKLVKTKKNLPQSLPDRIISLRDAGFFTQPHTADEVHAELQDTSKKDTYYYCEPDRVTTALRRLLKKGNLRKASRSDAPKLIAYVW